MYTTVQLIEMAQQGDEHAMNELLQMIKREHMPKRIAHYKRRNVLVDQTDTESAFLIGCWEAIPQAKLDVGNPLMFILWKGQLAVSHLFRRTIKDGVKLKCHSCGKQATIKLANRHVTCSRCGSHDVETFMVMLNEDQVSGPDSDGTTWERMGVDVAAEIDDIFNRMTYDTTVEELRSKLSGRVLELFDMLVVRGINRDSSDNYLAEIASQWGVSTAAVSVYLRKLRARVLAHMAAA